MDCLRDLGIIIVIPTLYKLLPPIMSRQKRTGVLKYYNIFVNNHDSRNVCL